MLRKPKQRNAEKGFTIIEVLIVLAIAGLILLIVFLAVPALQRSSRNTQRKNDVSALLSGASEFATDNEGTTPTTASISAGLVTFSGATGTSSVASAKLGYYTTAPTVIVTSVAGGSGTIPSAPAIDAADIIIGATCNGTNTPTTTGASARSFVAYYSVEQAGGSVAQCTESGA